jgi:hypothetical protein
MSTQRRENIMNKETKEALDNITDTMSGGDGGVRFFYTKVFIEDMDLRADQGDKAAKQLIELVIHFSRLINVSQPRKEST